MSIVWDAVALKRRLPDHAENTEQQDVIISLYAHVLTLVTLFL